MANNISVNPGTAVPVATLDIGGGVQSPRVNLIDTAGNTLYGSAGSPAAGVLTVQGVSGGTAQPISISSGTAAVTQSGTWTVGLSAGTNAVGTTTALQGGTWNIGTVTNLSQMSGAAISMGTGTRDAGTQRVTIATNDVVPASQSGTWNVGLSAGTNAIGTATALQGGTWNVGLSAGTNAIGTATALQGGTWTVQPGNTANTTPWLQIIRDAAGNARGANVNASNQLSVSVDGGTLSASISSTATLNTNLTQVGSATVTTGSGAMAAGTQRVALATDSPGVVTLGQTTMGSSVPVAIASNQSAIPITISSGTTAVIGAVNLTQLGSTTVVTAGVSGSLAVGGSAATNVAIGTNPINLGAQAITAENSTVTATRMVQLVADVVGKQIVLPYSNPENFVSGNAGALATGITNTAVTTLISAPGSGLRNYVTELLVTNAHATVSTVVVIGDGTSATTMHAGYAVAAGGGFSLTFPTPLRQPTTNTTLTCYCVTTGSAVYVSASGYKGV